MRKNITYKIFDDLEVRAWHPAAKIFPACVTAEDGTDPAAAVAAAIAKAGGYRYHSVCRRDEKNPADPRRVVLLGRRSTGGRWRTEAAAVFSVGA